MPKVSLPSVVSKLPLDLRAFVDRVREALNGDTFLTVAEYERRTAAAQRTAAPLETLSLEGYALPERTATLADSVDWLLVQKNGEATLSRVPAGSFGQVQALGISGSNDADTGVSFPGENVITFTEGAAECARFTADGEFSCGNGALLKRPGQSTATPVYTFALDADTGAGNNAANCFGVFTAGTLRAYWGGDGSLRAAADTAAKGTYYCGTSAIYWAGVYAQGGALLTSDAREKTDVVDSDLGLTFIQALRPVRYRWVQCGYVDESGQPQTRAGIRPHYGLLAQEVQAVMGESDFAGFAYDPDADAYCLRYDEFIAPLIKAVQELSAQIVVLEARIAALEA